MPTYTSRLGLPLPLGTEFHNLENYKALINMIDSKASSKAEFDTHTNNKSNPHGVTAAQVGAYSKAEANSQLASGLATKTNVRGYSNTTVTVISDTDLNDLTESGVFMGQNLVNAPSTSWWFVQNMVHNSNYITQIAYVVVSATSDRPRIRKKSNGVWGEWQALQFTSDNSVSATKLQTARTIAGVAFDGTSNISIPAGNVGAYTKAEVDSRIATTVGGNVASATKLQTARTINGVAFDGTANIEVLAQQKTETIPADADLDTYKTVGNYACSSNANAATLKNCPTVNAFTLQVLSNANSASGSVLTQILHEYMPYAGAKTYIRRGYISQWSNWYAIGVADGSLQSGLYAQTASRLATARAITLTGGVTGSATFDGTSTTTISTTITGNAPTATTATKLATARTIAGVSFDGTANIAIPAGNVGAYTKAEVDTALTEGLAKKTNTAGYSNSTVTQIGGSLNDLAVSGMFMGSNLSNTPDGTGVSDKWWFIQSMIHNNLYRTQVAYQFTGTNTQQWQRNLANGTWQAWRLVATTVDNVASATKLQTARTIALTGGVTGSTTFDGSGNVSISATVTGNAPSATKLATARTINGTAFDGTSNIEVTADPNQRNIPLNTNLDNLTTPGFWSSQSDGNTNTMTNTPFGTSTFTLQVETGLNDTRIIQTAKRASNGDLAIRYKTESMSSFSGWTGFAKINGTQQAGLIAEKAGSLQSSRTIALSGAVTGSVVFDGSSNATIATSPGPTVVNTTSAQTINGAKEFTTRPTAGGAMLAKHEEIALPMKGVLSGTVDWNNLTEIGLYYLNGITNKPNLCSNYGHLEIISQYNTGNVIQRYTDVNGTTIQRSYISGGTGWGPWKLVAYDSGWQNLAYVAPFTYYNSATVDIPKIRRINNQVYVTGVATVTKELPTNTEAIMMLSAPMPSWARSDNTVYGVQQGTGQRSWLLTAYTSGNLGLSRYGLTTGESVQAGHWLPYNMTWFVTYDPGI